MEHLEIECKWEANMPRAFARARNFVTQLGGKFVSKKLKITDTYLDHPNHDLSAQKIALRVRNTGKQWEVTFKTRTEIKNGNATRREETLPLPRVQNLRQALDLFEKKKIWQGIHTVGLTIQFTLLNKRTVCMFSYGRSTLEMALDNVTLYILGRQVKFKEIEVELKQGTMEELEQFAVAFTRATQLKRAHISKVKTAETFLKFWQK